MYYVLYSTLLRLALAVRDGLTTRLNFIHVIILEYAKHGMYGVSSVRLQIP
jgi:hypothetical protein